MSISQRSPEVVGFDKMAAEMDITHARVAGPAGVKLVLDRYTWSLRGARITNVAIRIQPYSPRLVERACSQFADLNLQSYPFAIPALPGSVHCMSHVTRRPRDWDVVFPVNCISGQWRYMLMAASTCNLDICPVAQARTSNTICIL